MSFDFFKMNEGKFTREEMERELDKRTTCMSFCRQCEDCAFRVMDFKEFASGLKGSNMDICLKYLNARDGKPFINMEGTGCDQYMSDKSLDEETKEKINKFWEDHFYEYAAKM